MAKENEYVEEAVNRLFELSADEKKRLEYEQREKAIRDYHSQMFSAEQRGIAQGQELKLKELVKRKLDKKLSLEEIAEILEEPVSQIKRIAEELSKGE